MELGILHEDFCKYFSFEKGRTQRTIASYKSNFNEFVRWLKEKGLPVDASSLEDYRIPREFMYHLSFRKLNKKTIRQRMLSLKSFCKFLVKEGILNHNPFDRFDIPKRKRACLNP